jgi:AcrR family transcriptional regulator
VPAIPTARARARAEISAEILGEARRQVAAEGAPGLSLRAVARALGMASSAVYRYFPSRDDLLTELIVESYDALGAVAEQAADPGTGGDLAERWRRTGRALRDWALAHPHEYALLYGSPVPGYRAPERTVGPASRVTLALAGLVQEAAHQGRAPEGDRGPALSPALAADAARLAELALPDADPVTVARALLAWTQIFGLLSFELFGHLTGVVEDPAALFDRALEETAAATGIGALPT